MLSQPLLRFPVLIELERIARVINPEIVSVKTDQRHSSPAWWLPSVEYGFIVSLHLSSRRRWGDLHSPSPARTAHQAAVCLPMSNIPAQQGKMDRCPVLLIESAVFGYLATTIDQVLSFHSTLCTILPQIQMKRCVNVVNGENTTATHSPAGRT